MVQKLIDGHNEEVELIDFPSYKKETHRKKPLTLDTGGFPFH